ncbi:MAG: carotenoid oxygenase family protein [Myxococcota bacterium]
MQGRGAGAQPNHPERGMRLPAVSSEDEGYAYVVVAAEEATDIFSAIGRVELATGKLQRRDLWPLIASEPVVCHDAAGREFVALVCTDALEETSVLTLLDARSLATIATFDIPQRLPPSFHGLWVSAGPEPALSSL